MIRFNGNYHISGPSQERVKAELEKVDAQATKLGVGIVGTATDCSKGVCSTGKSFVGILVTDEDAVEFLNQEGLSKLDLNRDKPVVQKEADVFLQQKYKLDEDPNNKADFAKALTWFSYKLRFIEQKFTEINLTE